MGRGSYEHMLKVAKKKQALGDIVDNISSYTDEEIDEITSQPTWIRKHLKTLKLKTAAASRMATMPTIGVDGGVDTTHLLYPVRQYIGNSQMEISNGQGFNLVIDPDDVFMIINDWEVKINSSVVKVTHEEGNLLIKMSKLLDSMTITDYNAYLQNVLDRKYNGTSHDIDERDTEYGWASAIRIDK